MRTNVIEALRKKSSENADSLLQKVKHRKHGLITDLLYCAGESHLRSIGLPSDHEPPLLRIRCRA